MGWRAQVESGAWRVEVELAKAELMTGTPLVDPYSLVETLEELWG